MNTITLKNVRRQVEEVKIGSSPGAKKAGRSQGMLGGLALGRYAGYIGHGEGLKLGLVSLLGYRTRAET